MLSACEKVLSLGSLYLCDRKTLTVATSASPLAQIMTNWYLSQWYCYQMLDGHEHTLVGAARPMLKLPRAKKINAVNAEACFISFAKMGFLRMQVFVPRLDSL